MQESLTTALAEDERALAQLVRSRLGITVRDHQILPFRRGIQQTLDRFGLSSYHDLTQLIAQASGHDPIMESLVAGVTVGESYFFRDPQQISFLEQRFLLPLLDERRQQNNPTLRIWSAGCSDGQELYTLLLVLDRLIPKHEAWQVHALGSDINKEALDRARQGRYSDWAMRGVSDHLKQTHFLPDGSHWQLQTQRFKASVKFHYLNLIEGGYPSVLQGTSQQDLILCRNVFIYFDNPTVDSIVERFARCLAPGGILVTGACDYVPNHIPGLVYRHEGDTFFFEKSKEDNLGMSEASNTYKPTPPVQTRPQTSDYKATPIRETASETLSAPNLDGLMSSLCTGDYDTVLKQTERLSPIQTQHHIPLLRRAQGLSALGQLDEAKAVLQALVDRDELNEEAHFLLGLVAMEQGNEKVAEEELRKVMLLSRNHLLSHYHMGFLKINQGRVEAGERLLNRALTLLKAEQDVHMVLDPIARLTIMELRDQLSQYLENDHVQ
ncbi:CheR family methyltransferase [Magnetococcus sp. PR-3]|uniref:CheR family methyltransferase n=1 Tax=Magnetococcus sp. PR-3 TaxID=3120355 RepID=UPI002FCE1DC2